MTQKQKLYRRTLWGLFTAGLAFTFVTLMGQQTVSSDDLTDAARRKKIENLSSEFLTAFPAVLDVTPQQAMNLISNQKSVFIDIRQRHERQVSMLPGSISKIEYEENLKSYQDHIKIAYGTISHRSAKFVQDLQQVGIPVYHLRGGILAWVHDGGKVYDRDGETQQVHVYNSQWNFLPSGYLAVW